MIGCDKREMSLRSKPVVLCYCLAGKRTRTLYAVTRTEAQMRKVAREWQTSLKYYSHKGCKNTIFPVAITKRTFLLFFFFFNSMGITIEASAPRCSCPPHPCMRAGAIWVMAIMARASASTGITEVLELTSLGRQTADAQMGFLSRKLSSLLHKRHRRERRAA